MIGRRELLRATGLGLAGLGVGGLGLTGCAAAGAEGREPRTVATYIPESYDDLYPGIQAFMDTATRESGGRLSMEIFDAGTLLGAEQLLPGLLLGVADVIMQTSSYVSSSFPILGAMELPFVSEEFARHRRAIDPDGPLFALVNEQLAGQDVRLLGGMPTSYEYLWTVDRPIRSPQDVRGMRIRVAGEIEGETVKALGGAPVSMGSSEIYEALERGTIDGMMSYVGTVVSRDLQQIIRYGTVAHFGAYTVDAYCRTDWYDAQPPALRAALDAGGRQLYRAGTEAMLRVHREQYLPAVRDGGVRLFEPTAAELAAFRSAVAPVYATWRDRLADPAVARQATEMIERA